jgi:glycerophosphoryl diester phosphodiesterase
MRETMQVIGHRGAAALAPENTWAGFDRALELSVDAIETDVQATSDGVLVLFHDLLLDRTTDGQGPVAETPWSVVRELDAGSWFESKYRGARVPSLDDFLERYGSRTHIALEIKQPGVELEALRRVVELGLLKAVTFTSFDFEAVERIRHAEAEAAVGFLTSDISSASVARVLHAGFDQFCPPADAVTSDLVCGWKKLELNVRAWGVRTPALMHRAIEAGVDGMTVDFPDLLLQALADTDSRS